MACECQEKADSGQVGCVLGRENFLLELSHGCPESSSAAPAILNGVGFASNKRLSNKDS